MAAAWNTRGSNDAGGGGGGGGVTTFGNWSDGGDIAIYPNVSIAASGTTPIFQSFWPSSVTGTPSPPPPGTMSMLTITGSLDLNLESVDADAVLALYLIAYDSATTSVVAVVTTTLTWISGVSPSQQGFGLTLPILTSADGSIKADTLSVIVQNPLPTTPTLTAAYLSQSAFMRVPAAGTTFQYVDGNTYASGFWNSAF